MDFPSDPQEVSKAVERLLSPHHKDPTEPHSVSSISDADISALAGLLEVYGKHDWAARPRIYAVLHLIGMTQSMEGFIKEDITDIMLPFKDEKRLPFSLKTPSAREAFVRSQQLVLTNAMDLEKTTGTHQRFNNGDIYYRTMGDLGTGGFGYVDKVWSTLSLDTFARKRIARGASFKKDKQAMQDFSKELKVLQRLKHDHLVEFVGSYTDKRYIAIIMRPVAKCNLAEYMRKTPFPESQYHQLRKFFGCLATGLRYLHREHIRHKDIKPSNILVSSDGNVLITDFGTALDWTESGKSTTQGSRLIGITPEYCAPEVTAYEARNPQSDIYSLGCVYVEMATILRGETIDAMRRYFDENGSKQRIIRTNPTATQAWLKILKSKAGETYDQKPLDWSSQMIQREPDSRPSSEELTAWTTGDENSSRFCCISCIVEEGEHTSESSDAETNASDLGVENVRDDSLLPEARSPWWERKIVHRGNPQGKTNSQLLFPSKKSYHPDADYLDVNYPDEDYPETINQFLPPTNLVQTSIHEHQSPGHDTILGDPSISKADPLSPLRLEETFQPKQEDSKPLELAPHIPDLTLGRRESAHIGRLNEAQNDMHSYQLNEQPAVAIGSFGDVTNQTKEDPRTSFKRFAAQEREKVEILRNTKRKQDKEVRLNELKRFAETFRLSTPVPSDIAKLSPNSTIQRLGVVETLPAQAAQTDEPRVNNKSATKNAQPKDAGPWSEEEETQLNTLKESDQTWAAISKNFPGRTKSSVKKHWQEMQSS